MIGQLSHRFVGWLSKNRTIQDTELALYEYIVRNILFSAIPIVMVLGLGIFLGCVPESLLFILPFILLRKFCGGFHLKSRATCIAVSVLVLAFFLVVIREILSRELFGLTVISVLAASALICVLSPVDSKKRALSEKEYSFFRKTSRIVVILLLVLFFGTAALSYWRISVPLGMGICLTAVLQIPCIADPVFKHAK